ncbi:TraR/DksA family transcriptional regulator [Chrysiogenes arsenatis]|uniref:TraR/DksA family transcriptional regulator n=1 Tax=Chrysiogenes arsenatis TaxID=309797 RepID=UPI000423A8EC|nr:TraR/DksA family transcriptional regulator [Chrysiogenes arsenatis]
MAIDIEAAKERLLTMKATLVENIRLTNERSNEFGKDGIQDSADEASNDYLRNIMLEINEKDAKTLRLIEQALERIAKGEYEHCLECGCAIGEKRLEFRPYARYCKECKEELEANNEVDDI